MLTVNPVFAAMVSPFLGLVNLHEGMRSLEGMTPMGEGLQLPPATCRPLVRGKLGTVRQKLM